jgi:hypothetical protein
MEKIKKKNLFSPTPRALKKGTAVALCMIIIGLFLVAGCKKDKPPVDTHSEPEYPKTITSNKTWNIECGYACSEGVDTFCFCYWGIKTIKTGNIKVLNGKEYYELITENPQYPQEWKVITYVREEGKKVFFYVEECDKEYLMYDYDLNVGDEVFLVPPTSPTSDYNQDNPCELTESDMNNYKFKVTVVDSIEYNQVKRKMLRLENLYPHRYDIWVEGIGCMRGIIYNRVPIMSGVRHLKDCYEADELIFVNENPEYCWIYPEGKK